MMHKYHNAENVNWTPPTLSGEQWQNAYADLKKHLESKIAFLEKENETLRLERDKALASWTDHPSYNGC